MDIKKRIQELSLDQKAKLYFMGLVRKGVIDTLPEDPKAAYVQSMMDEPAEAVPTTYLKKVDTSAAGLEPADSLDPNASDDRDNFPNPEDLEEIGMFHDPLGYDPEDSADSKEDKLKMAYAAYDKAEMNGDIRGQELALAVIDLLKSGELKEMATELGYLKENEPTVFDDESMDELLDIILKYVEDPDDAEAELDRFNDGGFDAMSDYVTANLDRDPEYKAWYNKLHSIKEEEEEDLRLEPEDDEYEDGTEFEDDDLRLEPEDMDDPDEDLVIIGSGYLDIKSNFRERPSMTNGEYAALGQKVVDQLHNGDKEAALNFIYSKINEDRDEEDEENDRNLASDDIPDSLREIATQLGYLKENHANQKYYKFLNVLKDEGHLHRYGVIQLQTEFGLKEKEAQEIYNQYKKDLMKEVDGMEGGIDLNAVSYEKVTFIYTEQGGRFYGLDVYENKDQDQRSAKLRYNEANEWLKDTLAYIHEGDLIPRRYNSGLEDLDLIVKRLEELGIEASHGDYMDVS